MLLVGALAVGALAAGCGGEEDQAPSNLLVQTAEGGGFSRSGQDVTLTLRSVSAVTTTFSDRPERASGAITTAEFVSTFDRAFGDDPPNATVSSLDRGRGEFTVELSDPRYEEATRTLTYAVRPIDAQGSDLPRQLGRVSVFIDPDTVAPSVTVSGRVIDEAGNGVGDATVTFGEPDSSTGQLQIAGSATTDDSGQYSVSTIGLSATLGATLTAIVSRPDGIFSELTETVGPYGDLENTQNFTLERSDSGR